MPGTVLCWRDHVIALLAGVIWERQFHPAFPASGFDHGGRNCNVQRGVGIPDSVSLAGERGQICLETSLSEWFGSRAKSEGVSAAMIRRLLPSHLGRGASLPYCARWLGLECYTAQVTLLG